MMGNVKRNQMNDGESERMDFTNTDQDDEGRIEMEMIGRSWRRDERGGEMMQAGSAPSAWLRSDLGRSQSLDPDCVIGLGIARQTSVSFGSTFRAC
jgi:hypothetical protein